MAHTTSATHRRHRRPPVSCRASERAAAGSSLATASQGAGQLGQRDHHAAEQEQHQVEAVGGGQGDLGPQRAGHEQAEPGEGDGREQHGDDGEPERRRAGRQPRTRATARARRSAPPRRRRIAAVLAASRRGRPSGVVPSRLSTPYWRSNPVAMPRLTMAVDITARARMPGARKSTGCASVGEATSTSEKNTSSTTGMPRVSSSDSPRRSVSSSTSALSAWRGTQRPSGSGRLRRLASVSRRNTSSRRLAAGPQVGERQVVLGQPGGQRGHGRRAWPRRRPGTRPVAPRRTVAPRRRRERGDVEARRGTEADLAARRPTASARPACPSATTRPWSMITTRSASRSASSSSWVVSSTHDPVVAQPAGSRPGWPAGRPGSTPAVGSSRNATSGRPTRARASDSRCCSPPRQPPPRRAGHARRGRPGRAASSGSAGSS